MRILDPPSFVLQSILKIFPSWDTLNDPLEYSISPHAQKWNKNPLFKLLTNMTSVIASTLMTQAMLNPYFRLIFLHPIYFKSNNYFKWKILLNL